VTTNRDPLGKQALFSPPEEVAGDQVSIESRGPEGTDALYSAPDRSAPTKTKRSCQPSTPLPVSHSSPFGCRSLATTGGSRVRHAKAAPGFAYA
jgi:hypothetical protein